ncbi:MAG: hypothetical protein U0176_16460 [Bacteroidia bacterium]
MRLRNRACVHSVLDDGAGYRFPQMPSSWGATFTAAQWEGFSNWLASNFNQLGPLPEYVRAWSTQGWKRLHVAYLIATGRYWAYPRLALATNFEDAGVHANTRGLYQVPLLMGPREWHFRSLQASAAVYDAHFDPIPAQVQALCPELGNYDFDVDLQGVKSNEFLHRPFVLTTRRVGEAVLGFADSGLPIEANLRLGTGGDGIRLVKAGTDLLYVDPLEREFSTLYGAERSTVMRLPLQRLPSISIILALDGASDHDGVTLRSILGQDFPGLRPLRSPSTDRPPQVWQAYQEGKLRMIEVGAMDGNGFSKAVNAASGQWIWIVHQACRLRVGVARTFSRMFRNALPALGDGPTSASGTLISKRIALYRWDNCQDSPPPMPTNLWAHLGDFADFPVHLWLAAGEVGSDLYEHLRKMGLTVLPLTAGLTWWMAYPSRRFPVVGAKARSTKPGNITIGIFPCSDRLPQPERLQTCPALG